MPFLERSEVAHETVECSADLVQGLPAGREALPMLEELKESIDAIALDGKWQQRFHVGIEGSLSVLVHLHSLRRARLKRWDGFQRHVPLCVIGLNLLRLLDWKHRQQAQAAAYTLTMIPTLRIQTDGRWRCL